MNKSNKVSSKKPKTIREHVSSSKKPDDKKRRLHKAAGSVKKPVRAVKNVAQKEYYIPLPKNKYTNFLNKKRRVTPKFFVEAWRELKLVSWPNRKETTQLTTAVLLFAVVFGVIIAIVDYGLDKVFERLLLK
ncbi:preprotein translocase subunit SecE [Candidatus Saccharibacteria bacterium]|nr:preprotein translocase subunit SecE [Candidatus Saccharibacteria bacterium]